jgi:PAS domain S-box-containing protein
MIEQNVFIEIADREVQLIWTASGDRLRGKSASRWCAYTGQGEEAARDWGWIEALHPGDQERIKQLWLQAIEQKHFFETWYRLRNYDGEYRTFTIRCMPILNDDGSVREWVSHFASATAERLSLEHGGSWQGSLRHDLFFEQASIGMVYTSIDGRFLLINEKFCSIVGYSREELIGRNFAEITPPEDVEEIKANIARNVVGGPDTFVDEKRSIRKDGETIWIRLVPRLLRLPSGEPLCYFTLVEDITERKHAEEEQKQLLEFERALNDSYLREKQEVAALTHQLRAAFEAMTDGVVFRDAEGKTLLMNSATRRLMELDPEVEVTGVGYQNLYSRYEIYDEHRRPLSAEQWPMNRIFHGETLSYEQAVDVIMRLPSGREVQYAYSGAPVYDRRGYMIGGVSVVRDVTESRQKERRVQQTLDALLSIVEQISRLPMQADNPTEAVPSSLLHTIGHTLTEIISQVLQCQFVACTSIEQHPDSRPDKLHLVGVSGLTAEEERVFRKELEQSFALDYLEEEEMARLRANEVVIRDLATRPYVQPRTGFAIRYRLIAPMLLDEQLVGILTIAKNGSDVIYTPEEIALVKAIAKLIVQVIERARLTNEWTEARANELALRETNRRFDAFLSIASHELRTPLTTIRGNVQLAVRRMETLKSQYAPQLATLDCYEQVMHALKRVYEPLIQAAQRVQVQDSMISDLLDASRIRANKLEIRKRPCDLGEIVRQMREDLQYVASDRLVLWHLPEQRSVPVMADPDRLAQVINNYVVNALRYSAPERPVEVSLEILERGTVAWVSVQDQGSGIPSQELEQIWDRFYRSHGTEKKYDTGAGLGLGLYICRTIIEQHDGEVGVESVWGKGSTFWFTLPIIEAR